MIETIAPSGNAAWRWLEQGFDRVFGASANPLRLLGALLFLSFALLVVSGVWLYAVFDTSVAGAHASVARLTQARWSVGALMHSVHRYATDAFVILTVLHLLRELLHGRWRHFRRFSWWTGCVLLPLIAVCAIGGFWLNWDELGQFSAIATAEWLDGLPLLAQPLARNFLSAAAVSDRLFSLFVFVHIGASLLLLLGAWLHLQRMSHAVVWPTRRLALGTVLTLTTLAVAAPVTELGAANLARVSPALSFDWLVLWLHPLMYASSSAFTWTLVLAPFALLMALPWLRGGPSPSVAVVDAGNCNGCRRCFADCPYGAVSMIPHPDVGHGRELAEVDAALCAGCGICAGACPSATPFRSVTALINGIDMPALTVDTLRRRLTTGLRDIAAPRPIVLFACARGADSTRVAAPDVLVLPLLCSGQLAPAFVEYALHDGAAAVLVASCHELGCEFRLGARWSRARLAARREPRLRASVSRKHVEIVMAERGEEGRLAVALNELRRGIAADVTHAASGTEASHG
ncbi:MAG: hydrogenase iron-sulfur subunit [Proteobacteria bacterium]|nr:hydrogenase iron-sulfur subunit [Pseudomonadota bacterium]